MFMIILAWIIAVLSVITIIIGFAGKLLSFEMSEANKVIGEVKGMTKEGSIIEFEINGEKKVFREKLYNRSDVYRRKIFLRYSRR